MSAERKNEVSSKVEEAAVVYQERQLDEWFDQVTPADQAEESFLAGAKWVLEQAKLISAGDIEEDAFISMLEEKLFKAQP